jgi:hypothetical protein
MPNLRYRLLTQSTGELMTCSQCIELSPTRRLMVTPPHKMIFRLIKDKELSLPG